MIVTLDTIRHCVSPGILFDFMKKPDQVDIAQNISLPPPLHSWNALVQVATINYLTGENFL